MGFRGVSRPRLTLDSATLSLQLYLTGYLLQLAHMVSRASVTVSTYVLLCPANSPLDLSMPGSVQPR